MTITKKHLKELADIVYKAQKQAQRHRQESLLAKLDLEEVAEEVKSFARRHAPNFSESHWTDYMHKLKKAEDKPEPNKQYRLIGKSGESSIARGNTWAESEIK